MGAHTCSSNTWEAEAGGHKFKDSLGYIMRLSPKKLGLNKVISEGSYYAYILGARRVKIFDIEKKI